MTEFTIRSEKRADETPVDAIVEAAFGRPAEVALVRELRRSAEPRLSLVAEHRGELIGHVFFSSVTIEATPPSPPVAGLAPLAVAPSVQGQGAGSALVRAGLEACLTLGWQAVFLLGSPAYYARFGFELAASRGLRYESESFDSAFQCLELVPGALANRAGCVRYHAAFDQV